MGKLDIGQIVRVLAIVAVLTAILAACGPAAPSPTAAPAKPAATTAPAAPAKPAATTAPAKPAATQPAAPPKMETVRYGIVSVNPNHWVVWAANDKGFMKKYGIELDLLLTGSSPAALQALVGGSMEMTTTSVDAAITLQEKTSGLRQFVNVVDRPVLSIVVRPEIKTLEDFRGKTAGQSTVKKSDAFVFRSMMLAETGMVDEKDYTIVQVGSVGERTAALQKGVIDGIAIFEPQASQLIAAGFPALTNTAKSKAFNPYQFITVIAKEDWLAKNRDTAVRFLQGWLDTVDWLYEPKNKTEAIQILAKGMKLEPDKAAPAYRDFIETYQNLPRDVRINVEGMKNLYATMQKLGDLQGQPPDVNQVVDNSVAEQALAAHKKR